MKVMAPLNDPVSRNRLFITDGSPRAILKVPGGRRRGAITATPTKPSTATATGSRCEVDSWSAPHCIAPAETATARPRNAIWRWLTWPPPAPPPSLPPAPAPERALAASASGCTAPLVMRSRCDSTTTNVTAIGTSTMRNTQRQDLVEASQPLIGGPISDGSTQAADTQLNTFGRSESG